MAIQTWQNMSILVGSLEMAGNAKNVSLSTEVAPLDVTPLSTTGWTTLMGGLKSGTVAISEFMQDFDAFGVDATLQPLLGTTVVKSICTASADGSVAYLLQSIPLQYTPISGAVGDLAAGTISGASATGPVVRGTLLHPSSVARTVSSTGTGRQLGAVVAGRSIYAALHVIAASGTAPSLTVILQSDDNAGFTSPTTRITFNAATGRTSQMSSLAGAVTDDWWRLSYTISGTAPSFTFAVTAGIL